MWGGGDAVHAHEPLHLIDTTSFLWNKPVTTGNEPMAHVGHSAVHAGTSMAVFGGYGHRQYWNELVGPNPNPNANPNPNPNPDPNHNPYPNQVLLDTGTMTWMRPHTSGHPPHPCVLHSAVVVRDLMVVYGGALDEKSNPHPHPYPHPDPNPNPNPNPNPKPDPDPNPRRARREAARPVGRARPRRAALVAP